jgi:hypothetical protein
MQDNTNKPSSDPAAIWWGSPGHSQRPMPEPMPPMPPPLWNWSWSPLIGIKYGPVPIGLIVAIPILIWVLAR